MSKTTTNYGLIKPELTDAADITAMNKNWDTIDAELFEASKLEWITLGSVACSESTTKTNTKQFSIPCDHTLLQQMSDFRYVLKSGAHFYIYTHCTDSNHGYNTELDICYGYGTKDGFINNFQSVAGYNKKYISEYTTSEDIIFRKNISTEDSLTIEGNSGTLIRSVNPEILSTLTSSITIKNNGTNTVESWGNGKVEYSFTIELQGKR